MPMVRRGYGNHVHILIIQNLADVLDAIGRIFEFALNKFFAPFEETRVRINQMGDYHVFLSSMPPI